MPLDYSYFKKRETRLSGGVITNGKKEIPIHDIRRVKCITNGTISNLCIYTTDKGRFFFDMPKMTVTLNALTVPLLEAVMTEIQGMELISHGVTVSDRALRNLSSSVTWIPGTSSIRTARLMRIGRRLPVTALPVMGTI